MKLRILTCLVVSMCIMSISCSKHEGQEYFPRNVSSRWEYNWQSNKPNKFGATKARMVWILDSEVTFNDKKYNRWIQVWTDMPGIETVPSYERIAKEGIYYLRDQKQPDKGEALAFTFPFIDGSSGSYINALDNVVKWNVESAGTVYLIDNKYDNCKKIINNIYNPKGDKLFTLIQYYAPNVGRIKNIFKAVNGYESEETLIKYNK